MSTLEEISEIPEKYRKHKDALTLMFKEYDVASIKSLIPMYRNNPSFKAEWKGFWINVSKQEGGKLSLTTFGILIGASLGGVGVAAMGGAIGMPLAFVLGLGGFFGGSTIDSRRFLSADKKLSTRVSESCYKTIESKAAELDISVSEYVKILLEAETEK